MTAPDNAAGEVPPPVPGAPHAAGLRWVGPGLVLSGGVLALAWADQPAGGALLAGVVLLLVVGVRGRRIIGGLLAVVAALLGVISLPGGGSGWDIPLVVCAVLGLTGALLLVVTARWWPARQGRHASEAAVVDAGATAIDVWKAMDAGHDPTAVDAEPLDAPKNRMASEGPDVQFGMDEDGAAAHGASSSA